MSRYSEIDLSGIRRRSIEGHARIVAQEMSSHPPVDPDSFSQFWDGLPDILAARDLKQLASRLVDARLEARPVLLFMGAHLIKTGLTPLLVRLMDEGLLTSIASHGAGLVHDLELTLFGRTSEDVGEGLETGDFGMDLETSSFINNWTREAAAAGEGLGEGLGRRILEEAERRGLDPDAGWLSAAYRRGIPATIHGSIGTDIYQQHPEFNGASFGETSTRDFRILAHQVSLAEGGVILNWGSAVILPEVFLKALSVARNLGHPVTDLTTAVFDFMKHYRPAENVVRRPTQASGWGTYIVGHHEIMIPLFVQGLLLELKRRQER
ncbi:MAG: hypothetical protein KJ970_06820 [Candidatus Eisenbacteria bacterium]|uniref:Deoxyhypusine synthase n=1 Tax=Eiseniibacteriota bacterium TaxID=2212470 RepID=A0A948W6G4_UNCEI|nr:hypothetical protein [Candidatus Eisenbacteria bacterium]MBU1950140.1 hypothetical protein [Candidatus Eisenbacteria bacterium]MBU2690626.1 hypothetical protein [Candidatus Eisenbacteria bacterium]